MAVRSEYDGLTDVFSPSPFLFPSPHSPAAFLVLLWPVCSVKDPAHDVQQVLEAKGNQVLLRKRYDSLVHTKPVSFPEYPLMCAVFSLPLCFLCASRAQSFLVDRELLNIGWNGSVGSLGDLGRTAGVLPGPEAYRLSRSHHLGLGLRSSLLLLMHLRVKLRLSF